MKFTAEEARTLTIELVSKSIGLDKIITIIDAICRRAQEGFTYLVIESNKFGIKDEDIHLLNLWLQLNGYKIIYPRKGVITIEWR